MGRGLSSAGNSTSSRGWSRLGASPSRAAIERGAEHRRRVVQRARHAGVLRALPGEEEGDARRIAAQRRAPCASPLVLHAATSANKPARSSSMLRALIVARWAKWARPALAVKQMSASSSSVAAGRARPRSAPRGLPARFRRARKAPADAPGAAPSAPAWPRPRALPRPRCARWCR